MGENKRVTPEMLLERWNQFAAPKYQNPDVLALYAEYNEKLEWGQSLEMPALMAADKIPHLIY
jgi:hypothetical protein